MSFQTGEFSIYTADALYGNALGRPAAAIFNDTIFILRPVVILTLPSMPLLRMNQVTFDLRTLATAGTGADPLATEPLKDIRNWPSTQVSLPQTIASPALATTAGAMYAFINVAESAEGTVAPFQITASVYPLPKTPEQPSDWGDPISLLESDKSTALIPGQTADVSATAFGENTIFVSCALASSATHPEGGTFIGVYDTADINKDKKTWAATWHTYLPFKPSLLADNHYTVSTEWYSTSGDSHDKPGLYLGLLVSSSQSGSSVMAPDSRFWNLPIKVSASSPLKVTMTVPTVPLDNLLTNVLFGNGFWLTNLLRDPGGRLRMWMSPRDGRSDQMLATYASTTAPLDKPLPPDMFGWGPIVSDVVIAPTSLFYIAKSYTTEKTSSSGRVISYPAYEFVFYGGEQIYCQATRCGTVDVLPGFSKPTLRPQSDEINIIAGMIDGPIPLPIENYHGHNLGSDTIEAGQITYGTTNTSVHERKVSDVWSVGFETSGEVTVGVGPAWDISVSGGMGSVYGNSSETSRSYDLEQGASIEFDESLKATLDPGGSLRKVQAEFSITAYRYQDYYWHSVDSTTKDPATAPKPASVLTTMVAPGALNFIPYMVTPGDLSSYTPEAINARMRSLGYEGDNYYGDVICRNAYPFGDPERPYLSYSLSPETRSGEGFTQFKSSFQENSWHLDAKMYIGISGGADIFGAEELEMKFLVGGDYSHESTETENTQSEWGIKVGIGGWVLPEGKTPESVAMYDFRVFFLPVPSSPSLLPPTYWTEELIRFMPTGSETLPTALDPHSGIWRISYAVTRIACRDSRNHQTYNYDGGLDRSSVYVTDDKGPDEKR